MDSALQQACQAVADDRYNGKFDRGFASLAFQLAYPDYAFTDDQADEAISIDKKGDLEADGIHIAAASQEILIFQSKSSSGLSDTDLHHDITTFLDAPARLCSDEWLKTANADLRALADDVRLKLANGYSIRAVFATASDIAPKVQSTFPVERVFQLPLYGAVQGEVTILGNAELTDRYRKLLLSEHGKPTDVTFDVSTGQHHQPDNGRVIYLTVPARVFTAACKAQQADLFRYNPRLYLGSNKVNEKIALTLKDPAKRSRFHLLNNGITAVSKGIKWSADRTQFTAIDFQIVNGCQTSMTLFKNESAYQGDDSCLVSLKIIETDDDALRKEISGATNTQTAIGIEDAVANDPEQVHIASLFDHYHPPYFYSAKRGAWEQLSHGAQGWGKFEDPDKTYGKYRKVSSKELASISLAILGDPESAKDRPRMVFEEVNGEPSEWYKRTFLSSNSAVQWLLPVEMHRRANAYLNSLADDSLEFRIGKYGRYRLLWLAYTYLTEQFGGETGQFIPSKNSERLLETCNEWAPELFTMVNSSLKSAYEFQNKLDSTTGLREFFRESSHQQLCKDHFATILSQWTYGA